MLKGQVGACAFSNSVIPSQIVTSADRSFHHSRRYFSTLTPFQKATYPLICFAAAFGSG
jgi:hypothetical protein